MTQQNDAYKLELDAKEFMATLQKAIVAYTSFGNKLKAAIRIRIDDQQLRTLSKYIGAEFKGVAQTLLKDLKPALTQVTKQAAKLDTAMGSSAKTAQKSAKKIQKAYSDSLVIINNEAVKLAARVDRQAQVALNKIIRLQGKIKDQRKLVDEDGNSNVLTAADRDRILVNDNGKAVVNSVLVDQIRAQSIEALKEQREVSQALNNQRKEALEVERKHVQANEKIAAEAKRAAAEKERDAKASLRVLEATDRMAAAAERYRNAAKEAAAAINHNRHMKGLSGTVNPEDFLIKDDMLNEVGLRRSRINEIRRQDQIAAAGITGLSREQAKYVRDISASHQNILTNLVKQGVHLAKFMVFYRFIADSINLVQSGINAVVRQGVEYTKQVETQQLGLVGILAENFKVEDSLGNQLTSVAAINALQGESVKQWQTLQASALSVVGTTADMMMLFNSILPFAARLGKNLEDVQKMTQATAIAASLMDVSFQDARSAIISLLQGRALTRNRLVGVLGITKSDIEVAKEAGTTFDLVFKRLDAFQALAGQARGTIAALFEQFRDLTGLVGKQFVAPFLEGFKRLMGEVGKGGIMGAMFEGDGSSLKPKKETEAFFSFVRTQIGQTIRPLEEFTEELKKEGVEGLMTYTMAARDAGTALVYLATNLSKAVLWTARFIAENRSLISFLKWPALIILASTALNNLGARALAAAARLGMFRAASVAAAASQTQLATSTNAAAGAAQKATVGMGGFAGMLTRIGAGLAVGGIITALGILSQKLFEIRERAESGKRAIKLLAEGDVYGAVAEARAKIDSKDPQERVDGLGAFGAGVNRLNQRFNELKATHDVLKGLAEDGSNALEIYKGLNVQQGKLNESLEDATGISRDKIINDLGLIRSAKSALSDTFNQLSQFGVFGVGPLNKAIEQQKAELEELMKRDATKMTDRQQFALDAVGSEGLSQEHIDALQKQLVGNNLKEIADANARLKKLIADRDKLLLALRRGNAFQVGQEKADELKFAPQEFNLEDDTKKSKRRDPFFSRAQDELRSAEILFETRKQIAQAYYDERIASEREFNSTMESIEVERIATSKRLADLELKEFRSYIKRQVAQKKVEPDDAKEELANRERDIKGRLEQIAAEEERLNVKREAKRKGAAIRIGDLQVEAATRIDQEIAQIFGRTEENVDKTLTRIAKEIADKFKAEGAEEKGQVVANRLLAVIPDAARLKASQQAYTQQQRIIQNLKEDHAQLVDQQERGEISVSEYLERSNANRQDQIKMLRAMAAALENIIMIGETYGMSVDQLEGFRSELATVNRELDNSHRAASDLRQVFGGVVSLLSEIQSYGNVFDGFGTGLSNALGLITSIVQRAGQLGGIKNTIDSVRKMWMSMGEGGQGGGFGKFFSMFSGGMGMQKNESGDMVATAASAALGAATFGVTAAISVAGALFQRAVDKAKETIKKTVDALSKQIADGSIAIGQGVADLEAQRKRLVKQYSGSKSGRKALKEMLPDIDDQIASLKDRITEIRKGFEEALAGLRMGQGPFADFAKELMELEKFTKDYLDTFVKDTPEWMEASTKVAEYFQLFLEQSKQAFEMTMTDFESQAVNSAERVISLMDEQKDLADQLVDLNEQRTEVQEEINELWKEELEHAKDVADARKRIADIMRDAAEQEAEIRRRGVMEAQLSVAERKAQEISQLRQKTLEELREAREQLEELEGDDSVNDRRRELQRRMEKLAEQESDIRQSQRLNEIRLAGAMRIAEIEGAMFGIAGDRYQLAARAADIEVRKAQLQVEKWRQTKSLIDAIIQGANGWEFEPPAGFPAIRVQIGDVVINNQDQSSNTTNVDARSQGGRTPGPDAIYTGHRAVDRPADQALQYALARRRYPNGSIR